MYFGNSDYFTGDQGVYAGFSIIAFESNNLLEKAIIGIVFLAQVDQVRVEIELRKMQYFLAIAEERSFTRAAKRCHVAQASLSRQIRSMEIGLEAQLFEGRCIQNDSNSDWLKPAFSEAYRVLKQDHFMISFYGWTQVDKFFHAWRSAGFRIVGHLVFRKQYASKSCFLKYQHEQAYLLAKGNPVIPENPVSDVIDMPYSGNKLHPTQKPVAALKPLIEAFTQKNDLVLDPFCGSGSALLAAKILNRRYLGIELDPQYHAAANKRLHPDGIRASEGFYSPLKGQASRPQPPIGGALQSSAIN